MISISATKRAPSDRGIFSPLRYAVFRRIWTASLLSNLGLLVLGVGAAWAMTKISSSTGTVALVQTSLMLPVALVSTPAGAIADMFDRRIVGLVALSIALAGSISLSALTVSALMPIVARDLLHGGAQTYGVMLGAFGMGAVIGALNISTLRRRLGDEASIRLCMIVMGVCVALVAISRLPVLSGSALVFAGAGWTASVTLFNVGVQLAAPRWVAGRALAAYQAAITGGIALGSWMWGSIAAVIGVEGALLISAVALVASPLLGLWMRMPTVSGPNELSLDVLADPEVRLSLTPRSGPIVIEIEYRVDPAKARLFYAVMQHVQISRQRNGAYGWSIARDIADPELWTERYHCPTWHDYLRQRSRSTASERALHVRAIEFHIGPEPIRIRRMLERPIGSVRWKEDTPDRSTGDVAPITSPGSGP
jgi:MFS family permease